jgi:polyisoprenoid-binding protein YceI
MRTPAQLAIVSAACLAIAWQARAQETALEIDPAQTTIEFTLGTLLHTVHGTFQLKRGSLRWDPASGRASGELAVDAASGESGNPMRDRRMHTAILQSDRYPEITFRPDRVEGTVAPEGASPVRLHGKFTIHGVEHDMTLPVAVNVTHGRYTATLTFTVPYVQWGMKNPSTLFLRVNDTVSLTVHTVAKAVPQT